MMNGFLPRAQAAKQQVQIVGLQPAEGAQIPGIRRWPKDARWEINGMEIESI